MEIRRKTLLHKYFREFTLDCNEQTDGYFWEGYADATLEISGDSWNELNCKCLAEIPKLEGNIP